MIGAAGDVPTLEALAAVDLLRQHLPELKVRFVNVVDLMRLQDETEHPHGLSGRDFDTIFTPDKPVIFAYHGYPWLIHRLTYRRSNDNLHVRGYKEEGTTTTPFDMVMLNDLDRYHLVIDVIDRVPGLGSACATLRQQMVDKRLAAREYTRIYGDDIPEVRDWVWPDARGAQGLVGRMPPQPPAGTTSSSELQLGQIAGHRYTWPVMSEQQRGGRAPPSRCSRSWPRCTTSGSTPTSASSLSCSR